MAQSGENSLLQPLELVLRPDPSRVALRPFTPAEDSGGDTRPTRPRVQRVVDRVLSLTPEGLGQELDRIVDGLAERHGDLERMLLRRFHDLAEQAVLGRETSQEHKLVIGGYFLMLRRSPSTPEVDYWDDEDLSILLAVLYASPEYAQLA